MIKLGIKFSFGIYFLFVSIYVSKAHGDLEQIIPSITATHTAQSSGDWFVPSNWLEGTVPGDAAIVYIPQGISITYEGTSSAHIFAIRVDGNFTCTQSNSNDTTSLTFDTFIGTSTSDIKFLASDASAGNIIITIKPFDIKAHKDGTSGYPLLWPIGAQNHFSDQDDHYQVTYDIGPDSRFKTYDLSLAGDTSVDSTKVAVNDGAGILGRSGWDPTQLSIGLVTTGLIEIFGQEKSTMAKLSADALKNDLSISLENIPAGWEIGDSILITLGGNKNATTNGTEVHAIEDITGSTITVASKLKKNHQGRSADNLHCYVGNLNRNILFQSDNIDSTHRGHLMAMHNPTQVHIKNAAFRNMGRTDKGKLVDDKIWNSWQEPIVPNTNVSALGQECSNLTTPEPQFISNHRGRYSIHLHKLGATYGTTRAEVTGNVIWGNPGWGITHHDSHANISENVVFEVTGSGIISESGSETGFWDNNLVVDIDKGHTTDVYEASLFYDDYLFSGQGLGMKGRAIVCRGNVIADAKMGIGVVNFNAATSSLDRVDPDALAQLRPGYTADQFLLHRDNLSAFGNGILPLEVALIFENTTIINSLYGLSSIERDMGVNHESRSVFHNLKVWGANTGVRITYQNDYSFRDLFVSGRNDNSIGLYMWKHSHNHSFERVKLVDLKEGITASRLVENLSTGTKKTRNNGFTPWLFIDLETENVTDLYGIHLDNSASTTPYTEHPDNPIHITADQLSLTRPITFTINEQADLTVNLNGDFRFEVDGAVTDRIGAYEFGIEQASSMQSLRFDYPTRIYEFASLEKLEDYLRANGVYKNPDTDELYFIINEYVPDRISYEYKSFPIRITLLNALDTGLYVNPLTEDALALAPQNELISRFATATQSSTSTTETFDWEAINVPASRALDGNSNARINANFYQFGLDSIGSSAVTNIELEPWWEMDLGEEKIIEYIDIWNTVTMQGTALETSSAAFTDFYVLIDDQPFGPVDLTTARANASYEYLHDNPASRVISLDTINTVGRYIRIQAIGTTQVSLAEVDVIGRSISTQADCHGDVGGTAYIDECEDCVQGNTGLSPCALDANYEWGGTATTPTTNGSVLSVELISFTGKLIKDQTRLNWSSQSESSLSHYELQRSKNARNWQSFQYTNAKNKPSSYKEWDHQPYLGTTYYRLKIIEENESFYYSNIIAVDRENNTSVTLYPNPTSGIINVEIDLLTETKTNIKIVDLLGRTIKEQSIFSASDQRHQLSFDLSNSIGGTYFLYLQDQRKTRAMPFVVVRD